MAAKQIKLFQHKHDRFGLLLVSRFQAFQEELQMLGERPKDFSLDDVVQLELFGDTFESKAIIGVKEAVEIDQDGVRLVKIYVQKSGFQEMRFACASWAHNQGWIGLAMFNSDFN